MDFMIDLETMGTEPDAAIVAIGVVPFSVQTLRINKAGFYTAVDLESSMASGGTITAPTILWWLQQPDVARKEITTHTMALDQALIKLNEFIKRHGVVTGVWGNGAVFDNVILRSAYDRLKFDKFWSYSQDRCYRTIVNSHSDVQYSKPKIKHHAFYDARAQAETLVGIYKRALDKEIRIA